MENPIILHGDLEDNLFGHLQPMEADGGIGDILRSTATEYQSCHCVNNNNNNTVISIALFTDRPGALTTSDVCSTLSRANAFCTDCFHVHRES